MAVETARDVARALARGAIEAAGDSIDGLDVGIDAEVVDYLAATVNIINGLTDEDVKAFAKNANAVIPDDLLTGFEQAGPVAVETPPEPEPAPPKPVKAGT